MPEQRQPLPEKLSRPILNERDYREAKAVLAHIMRPPRSTGAALRAEALLQEIVNYELRLDAQVEEPSWETSDIEPHVYQGLRRRWSDATAEGLP